MKNIFILVTLFILIIISFIIYKKYNNMINKNNKTTWKYILNNWSNGNILEYPKFIKNRFFWETTPITNENSIYEEKFIPNKSLNNMQQDWSTFDQYIKKSKNKYVTNFYNLSGDTMLIVPIPKQNQNFTTLKDFIDNASTIQQTHFWKEVAKQTRKLIKYNPKNTKYWISVHGKGVPFLHIRICTEPKYYITKQFTTI